MYTAWVTPTGLAQDEPFFSLSFLITSNDNSGHLAALSTMIATTRQCQLQQPANTTTARLPHHDEHNHNHNCR